MKAKMTNQEAQTRYEHDEYLLSIVLADIDAVERGARCSHPDWYNRGLTGAECVVCGSRASNRGPGGKPAFDPTPGR